MCLQRLQRRLPGRVDVDGPPAEQALDRSECAKMGNKCNIHGGLYVRKSYISMVFRIKPTAKPSISKGSPGSTTMVW